MKAKKVTFPQRAEDCAQYAVSVIGVKDPVVVVWVYTRAESGKIVKTLAATLAGRYALRELGRCLVRRTQPRRSRP